MRKDIVSGKMAPKKKLIRIVRQKDGKVFIDKTGKQSGRGAYIGMSVSEAKQAKANKTFNKAFSVNLDDKFYDRLIKYADHEQARQKLLRHDK
ncbi:MAG: YlxR family protein [Acetilactobacillus jinshanensis]